MNLEDLVPDRELCRQWKEKRGRQDTQLYWICAWNRWTLDLAKNCRTWNNEKIAAPTVGELMDWMREHYRTGHINGMQFAAVILNYVSLSNIERLANALLKMALEVVGK